MHTVTYTSVDITKPVTCVDGMKVKKVNDSGGGEVAMSEKRIESDENTTQEGTEDIGSGT